MTESHWAHESMEKARKPHPEVNDAVRTRVMEILVGKHGERLLRDSELTSAAKALIADTVGPAAKGGRPA